MSSDGSTFSPAPGLPQMDITRHVRCAMGVHLHWRECGAAHAPPLVLLHPSPRSSAMFEPWMPALARHWRVLAVDTPGYGGSDALPGFAAPGDDGQLGDYVPAMHALLQDIAGHRWHMYGSATGAQLAIALALRHPASVAHLLLDNAAHFDDEERAHLLVHYFPDLTPTSDGSHLQRVWTMAAQMLQFFPWFENNEAHRVSTRVPSLAEVHAGALELLAAGPNYARAYRAAFLHERAEHVQALQVPTTLLRWQGSILLRHIDRLLQFPLPPQVQVLETPMALDQRYAVMTAHLQTLLPLRA